MSVDTRKDTKVNTYSEKIQDFFTSIPEILKEAANRNILVFDADAQSGEATSRLIKLMQVVAIRNGLGNIVAMLTNEIDIAHLTTFPVVVTTYPMAVEYEKLGASIQAKDQELLIAICENGPLSGSY